MQFQIPLKFLFLANTQAETCHEALDHPAGNAICYICRIQQIDFGQNQIKFWQSLLQLVLLNHIQLVLQERTIINVFLLPAVSQQAFKIVLGGYLSRST